MIVILHEGHVCLNILRLDWNPVLPLTAIFFGLLLVLLEPDGQEPLNQGKEKLTIIQFTYNGFRCWQYDLEGSGRV